MERTISARSHRRTLAALLGSLFLAAPAADANIFAKYDGIDGESQEIRHPKWIDVLSVDWGMHRGTPGATSQSRRRGAVVIEDIVLTVEYDKASPKIQEKCLKGEIIPKLEIEQTRTSGGGQVIYLKYEFTNVAILSYRVNASGAPTAGRPVAVIGCDFEQIKVTHTEYDDKGGAKGNVSYTWTVETPE